MFRIKRKLIKFILSCIIVLCLILYLPIFLSIPNEKHFKDYGNEKNQNENVLKHPKSLPKKEQLIKSGIVEDLIINASDYGKCPIKTEKVPQPDIQMLEMYKYLPFRYDDDSWSQIWRIHYDPLKFNKDHKLKVFVVPHSHNDPGWRKTFDDYYEHDTKHILSNALRHLTDNSAMKFIWAEISYFSRFYDSLNDKSKEKFKKLVKNGQLEFVTGGWVMPDEANSHWYSVLLQLTEGQKWLQKNLNTTPISSWSIDPFGHSSTMPYLLKKCGFENLLIQRTHYSVKKHLARQKQLEFKWRQTWDGSGETELFTHMMPFASYTIGRTCGPNLAICQQFDFFRKSSGVFSWLRKSVAPVIVIDNLNVAKRAELIIDQWRKKSVLYKTRSVLIPLGGDLRYKQSTEWQTQRTNYEKLFDYINNEPNLFTEAKFATLQEYFDSVRHETDLSEFPTLSGDFFTYADRDDDYWSGYYTSRPYHKRMDRVLLHYIRSAEMMRAWHNWDPESKLDEKLEYARRQLSLFQHHDGITGTAKNHVVKDYATRMEEAIKNCKFVMQQTAYRLLTYPPNLQSNFPHNLYIDDARWPGAADSRMTIIVGDELPYKHLIFQNTLPQWREEFVEFFVSKQLVYVETEDGINVPAQVSSVWRWHRRFFSSQIIPSVSNAKFRLLFQVKVPPIGLASYVVLYNPQNRKTLTSYPKMTLLTRKPFSVRLSFPDYPRAVDVVEPHELSIPFGEDSIATFNVNGLLKSISLNTSYEPMSTHLTFVKYGTRSKDGSSGAYLFLPDGYAKALPLESPTILLTEGNLESSVIVGLPFATHSTILRGDTGIEIRNLVDISNMDNTELVMRISTGINSEDIFYTDLNGFQIIKRKRFSKIPLQGNYYPVPSSIYIEDAQNRLTILSAQPLGGSSLNTGEIEIMQDRRLMQDDKRGLGQGVMDNKLVQHIFRLLLESLESCVKRTPEYAAGFLTATAYKESQRLLTPINKFIWNEKDWFGALGNFGKLHEPLEDGMEVSVMRSLDAKKNLIDSENLPPIGIVVHRTNLELCGIDGNREGVFNLKRLLNLKNDPEVYSSHLTFLKALKKVTNLDIYICPMDIKGFIIKR